MNKITKETNEKIYSGGYDFLKFVMACLIVAIHSQAFYGHFSSIYLRPITGIAVPVFFILSSFFYFKRIHEGSDIYSSLKHYLQRIGTLYLFWLVVNLPVVYHQHHYFSENFLEDIARLVKDVLFRATFSGSWFFSASVLAICVFSFFYRIKVLQAVIFCLSVIVFLYINCIELVPNSYHGLYDWWVVNVRDEVRLTVLEALPWVGLGMVLSTKKIVNLKISKIVLFVLLVIFLFFLLYTHSNNYIFYYALSKFLLAIVLVLLASNLKIECNNTSKHCRKLSTLFYMIHFDMLLVVPLSVRMLFHVDIYSEIGGLFYYFIILLFTFLSSEIYLYLSNKRKFGWLKYGF